MDCQENIQTGHVFFPFQAWVIATFRDREGDYAESLVPPAPSVQIQIVAESAPPTATLRSFRALSFRALSLRTLSRYKPPRHLDIYS